MGTDFQVYLVTLVYRLNGSFHSLSLQDNVLLEQLDTTAIKWSYNNILQQLKTRNIWINKSIV